MSLKDGEYFGKNRGILKPFPVNIDDILWNPGKRGSMNGTELKIPTRYTVLIYSGTRVHGYTLYRSVVETVR